MSPQREGTNSSGHQTHGSVESFLKNVNKTFTIALRTKEAKARAGCKKVCTVGDGSAKASPEGWVSHKIWNRKYENFYAWWSRDLLRFPWRRWRECTACSMQCCLSRQREANTKPQRKELSKLCIWIIFRPWVLWLTHLGSLSGKRVEVPPSAPLMDVRVQVAGQVLLN